MKLISENTEKLSLTSLEEISKDIFGWRGIHIKISHLDDKRLSARKTIQQLTKLLTDVDFEIYLYADFDIIAVYKGASTFKLSESVFSSLQIFGSQVDKFCNFYDLEKNLSVIKSIINRKIELKDLEKKALEQSKIEEKEDAKTSFEEIDLELLKSLSERKSKNEKIKILLVEDDAFSRRLVRNILTKNYEVIEAETAREAYFKYVMNTPNVVFLDINLPDSSGMNLLESLTKADEKSFIVMLSGNAFKDNIVDSMKKGAKGFVAKPFPKEKIEGYLEKYKVES